jgi:hypothetical protein
MKTNTLTWADFEQHEPCYSPAEKYGEWSGTILDLLQHPDIPDKDKIWAFTRKGIVDDRTLRLFAVKCAREVQHLMKDERSINALDVAERYANGEATEDELSAARVAAEGAAWAAASEAAWDAAAAWAAARYAAWDAAWDAAEDAAGVAERGAARVKQVQIAISLLT